MNSRNSHYWLTISNCELKQKPALITGYIPKNSEKPMLANGFLIINLEINHLSVDIKGLKTNPHRRRRLDPARLIAGVHDARVTLVLKQCKALVLHRVLSKDNTCVTAYGNKRWVPLLSIRFLTEFFVGNII